MGNKWQVQNAKARFSEFLEASLTEGPQIVTRRGVETAVLLSIDQCVDWRTWANRALRNCFWRRKPVPTRLLRRGPGAAIESPWPSSRRMYLLDTNVVSELRRLRPHGAVLDWIAQVPAEQLFISAVTVGEIQAGIEMTREVDETRAEELGIWMDRVLASYSVLPMDANAFREWARLMHRGSGAVSEDTMIAATAVVHRLTVVTRNLRDFQQFDVALENPFESR